MGWIRKTSMPLTFSSILTLISPSLNLSTLDSPSLRLNFFDIAYARFLVPLPEKSTRPGLLECIFTLFFYLWLGRQDSNLRMAASKAAALPLGHSPTFQNVFYSINCLKGESSKLLTNTDELNFSFALSASSLLEKLSLIHI